MYISNLVYKSLDVRYTVFFFTNTNFVTEKTSGHVVTLPLGQVVTLLIMEHIVCICGMNRANCDTDTNVGM